MLDPPDETLARAKEGAFREVAVVDAAYARGELDDAGWHRAMAAIIVPAYLRADTPCGGSGHSGTEADWEWSRGLLAHALHRSGTFLDVGCANALLMQSVTRWGAERRLAIEAHGLEIAPELAELARRRAPELSARIHVGNGLGFRPPRRFDYVRTGLEYVPAPRRRALLAWLLDEVVGDGGRLIVGKYNEELERHDVEQALRRWGLRVAGRVERAHRSEPGLAYRACWIDAPRLSDGDLRLRALRESDLPMLTAWLARPHVARWWKPPLDLVDVRAKYLPRIVGDEPTYMLVAEQAAHPIGWAQWYRWADYPEHATRLGAEPSAVGIDLGLGEGDRLGQGLGPRILRALVAGLFADPSVTACVSDPSRANTRSLRAFEKAGFTRAGPVQGNPDACVVRRER